MCRVSEVMCGKVFVPTCSGFVLCTACNFTVMMTQDGRSMVPNTV